MLLRVLLLYRDGVARVPLIAEMGIDGSKVLSRVYVVRSSPGIGRGNGGSVAVVFVFGQLLR